MHRKVKRAAAKTLTLALVLSAAAGIAPDSQAAKKPKLSAKKVTLAVKKTKKIKIKNVTAKQIKNLKVTSNKTKIATAKKNKKTLFTITAKKAGTATITAKLTLKAKKKPVSLKVKVTVKKATPPTPSTDMPATSAPATTTPPAGGETQTTPPAGDGTQTTPPSVTTDPGDGQPKPEYTAAPNAGKKRITHTSDIENPIINNISIWGLRDNPYAESGYDYTQYGSYTGIFTKWYAPKDSFKAIHELFNPTVSQNMSLMSLKESTASESDTGEGDAPLYTIGDTGETVKSIVTTSKLDWDSDTYTDVVQHSVDFVSRTSTANMDQQRVTVVDAETLDTTGEGSEPAVLVSGRANNWHGIQIDITDFMPDPTKDYRLSMDITHKTASQNGYQFYTQIAYLDANGNESDDRPTLVMQSAAANQWKTYAANFSPNGSTADRIILFVNWYGESSETTYPAKNPHNDFYIKNVTVSEISSDTEYDTTEILAYSPLYQNTEKNYGFSLGGAIGNSAFKDPNYKDVLSKHFSSMTIDNDLKMYSMLDEAATKASEDGMPVIRKDGTGEEMVKWAYENGIGVRGHTIVCDTAMSTNCKYFFHVDYDTSKDLVSKEVMLKRLESFITQCITYFEEKYPGTIYTWDVVNEAIATTSGEYNKDDACKIQTKDNLFYDTIGGDYVEYSFLYARQAVNTLKEMYPDRDINIQLFYNDFNCFERTKRDAIVALAQKIQAFGNARNMGGLIDGIGMQCYIGSVGAGASALDASILETNGKQTANSIPNAVFKFHDLGLNVQFTELTIRNYKQAENAAQAEYYKKFMQMAIDINNGTMTKVLE